MATWNSKDSSKAMVTGDRILATWASSVRPPVRDGTVTVGRALGEVGFLETGAEDTLERGAQGMPICVHMFAIHGVFGLGRGTCFSQSDFWVLVSRCRVCQAFVSVIACGIHDPGKLKVQRFAMLLSTTLL